MNNTSLRRRWTHRRHRLRGARRRYPIGPPYVFAMDVPV